MRLFAVVLPLPLQDLPPAILLPRGVIHKSSMLFFFREKIQTLHYAKKLLATVNFERKFIAD